MTTHKDTALTFLQMVTAGNIAEAFQKYVSQNFRHHNPFFQSDAHSLQEGMEANHQQFPDKVYEAKHLVEEGELVAVHGSVKLSPEIEIAVLHLFRFENDKIIELWDVGQQIPKEAVNNMF